ncbi:MAG: hypothetical protein J7501_07800 [Bdellovibrio sp.]|nr:hypothetical protein [Bdellovibrio sp.]
MVKKFFLITVMAFWGVGTLLLVSQFYGWHLMSFSALPSLGQKQQATWGLTHVVSAECKCSAKVIDYLIARGPSADAKEEIVVLGPMPAQAQALKDKGYSLRALKPEEMTDDISHLGVPFLLISTPQGDNVYAGGYSEKSVQDGSPIRDLEILHSLQGKGTAKSFPIFGCAVSRRLQKVIDPFSIKYTGQVNDEL